MRIEKTVFICYRRANFYTALAVFKDLEAHGYDVFLDYRSISSGDWRQFILDDISARAHFLIILAPSMLAGCVNPDDIARIEIEHAIAQRRNIVPLFFEGFKFSAATDQYLSPAMKALPSYNGINIHDDYFDEGMTRLRTQFLSHPLDVVLHPLTREAQATAAEVQRETRNAAAIPTPAQPMNADLLRSREEPRIYSPVDEGAITSDSEAIRLDLFGILQYLSRASARMKSGDYEGAIADCNEVIRINTSNVSAYQLRGSVWLNRADYERAITDFTEAIRLDPSDALTYNLRASARLNNGDYEGANADFTEAIRLNPSFGNDYDNRGIS
jgi:tetratricopeptide (TPR) repeat protein